VVSVAATYSVSTIYKRGYAFEDDGFSHLSLTVGFPVTIGRNLTITPSVTYVESLGNINKAPEGNSDVWNQPGWLAAVKASWQF